MPGGLKFPGGALGDNVFGLGAEPDLDRRGEGATLRLGDLEWRLRRCRAVILCVPGGLQRSPDHHVRRRVGSDQSPGGSKAGRGRAAVLGRGRGGVVAASPYW